ncbi:hypothetical protein NLI96_g5943 [Meripilus lineatus]|uniref:Uncharacterized protein n=1 Tax=Meripilus lineatus TaxID=2056292 RepID=A0AAD5YIJ1_9APHY|nr:hypothetical protein NLI96_g5943 [Physisporinus lineatus]
MQAKLDWMSRAQDKLLNTWTFQDGLVGTGLDCGEWVITSPNMDFVPQPVLGRIQVLVREDGRYGVEDPIQWPQFFSTKYCHFPLILRHPSDPEDHRRVIWWRPTPRDFIPIHGSVVSSLGTLASVPWDNLANIARLMSNRVLVFTACRGGPPTYLNFCDGSMRTALNCLRFPSTYRDLVVQVANVQRYWLEADAWLRYMESYKSKILDPPLYPSSKADDSLMGCFVTDPSIAFKLFAAGIPFWLVRSPNAITNEMAIQGIVQLTRPTDIVFGITGFGQQVYHGHVGQDHHHAIVKGAHTYMDIPRIFLSASHSSQPVPSSSSVASTPMSVSPSKSIIPSPIPVSTSTLHPHSSGRQVPQSTPSRGSHTSDKRRNQGHTAPYQTRDKRRPKPQATPNIRDKFVEGENPLFPPRIPVWSETLAKVDRRVESQGRIEYFVPEPALIIGPKDPNSRRRYLFNWAKARDPWLYLMTYSAFQQKPIHQQGWCNYLNHTNLHEASSGTTHTAKEKAEVLALFQGISVEEPRATHSDEVLFFGKAFSFTEAYCREVLWEVFEMGFQLELLALDKILVPAPSVVSHTSQVFEYERHDLISRVFGNDGHLRVASLPTENCGLAAENIADRISALEAFRIVLVRWPGAPQLLCTRKFAQAVIDRDLLDLEQCAVKFYLDTFYFHSSRATLVPHRFPL